MTIYNLLEIRQHEPKLTEAERLDFEQIARRCARSVRWCATDEQAKELKASIVEALAFVSGRIQPRQEQS